MRAKAIVVAVLLAAFSASVASADAEIKDMKQSDWAYSSVKKLVDKGYLALYDTGEFRGGQALSRVVFAAALAKLIDQIERGEIGVGGGDLAEIKKLSDIFKNEISDYDNRMKALDQRVADNEKAKVVLQNDLSKAIVEFRERTDALAAENKKMRDDIGRLNQDVAALNRDLDKERSDRKKAQTTLWIGVAAAAVLGAASN